MKLELRNEEKEFKDRFGEGSINLNLEIEEVQTTQFQQMQIQPNQAEELQNQLKIKKLELESLANSAKSRLKSKSVFSSKGEKRNSKLESLFKSIPAVPEELIERLDNIKPKLSEELTKEEINQLCQKQKEVIRLQVKLEDLSEQTAQILQTNQPYGTPSSSK